MTQQKLHKTFKIKPRGIYGRIYQGKYPITYCKTGKSIYRKIVSVEVERE